MILYFSGTGNSRFAAERIAAVTGDPMVSLNERIRCHDETAIENETRLIFVAPTYAWRLPRVVEAWIEKTALPHSAEAYFILTCGDSAGNAAKYAQKLCARKGLRFMGLRCVIMPENYIAMFDAPEAQQAKAIVKKAVPEIDELGRQIAAGEPLPPQKIGLMDRIYSTAVNPVFYKFVVSAKAFRVDEACVGCGNCANVCPLGNITLQDGKPVWGKACTHCMACICLCPKIAIEYGTNSVGKPRYRCPETD